MTITVTESWDSRNDVDEIDSPSAERKYLVEGTEDEQQVIAALKRSSPTKYGKLERTRITVGERNAHEWWDGVVHYELPPWTASSFDISATTTHITQSKETLHRLGPYAPNLGGQINVDGQETKGVDVYRPATTFQVTKTVDTSGSIAPYLRLVDGCINRVNKNAFQGYKAGEVLMIGAPGQRKNASQYEVNFKFVVQLTQPAQTIGPSGGYVQQSDPGSTQQHPLPPIYTALSPIAVPERPGWSYTWISYRSLLVFRQSGNSPGNVGTVQRVPVGVYVERLYDEADFDVLGVPAI